jgi:AAA domain
VNALTTDRYSERCPPPLGEPIDLTRQAARFQLVDWNDVEFDPNEEWLVDDVLPLRGFGLIYGKPRSFKSFTALDLALHVVLGAPWAGKRVSEGKVVYIAAEGAAGMRKRIEACKMKHNIPRGDFALIESAPNLGVGEADLAALIAAVESAGVVPGLIVIDTASKSIGAAEENGIGMAAFVGNAERLAQHFECLVLGVHHVGLGEDAQKRPRGWSGLGGALDVQILCERPGDEKRATLTVQKLKDEQDGICFEARLQRVVVGVDKNGKDASTLVVDEVVEIEARAAKETVGKRVPPSQRLLSQIIAQAIEEAGETFRPFLDGPLVRGVCDERARERYYIAIAEKADPDDDPGKVAGRKRKKFNRAIKGELDAKRLTAKMVEGRRLLWQG